MKSTILSVKLINEELSTLSESIYDIVILGAGSGGYATALRAAQLGMKVALIDGDKVGGTCLHRGCIPTKAYLHAAETAEAVRESAKFGVNSTFNGIDMAQVGKYRDSVISGLYKGLQGLLKSRKVELISGWGRLADANTVEVGGQRITGRNIVLATGSYSRSIPGLDIGGRIISSDQALQMDWVPSSAVILGGGVIGLEFASVWRSFGAEVTIIEALPHLANNEDEAISKQLERAYRKRGIKFHTNTRFASATQSEQGVHVSNRRRASRSTPTSSWSLSAEAPSPRAWATSRSASRWSAASSSPTSACTPALATSTRSAISFLACSSLTAASCRASSWQRRSRA